LTESVTITALAVTELINSVGPQHENYPEMGLWEVFFGTA
jgi:hypothetical protein